jgi:hypothetical protein
VFSFSPAHLLFFLLFPSHFRGWKTSSCRTKATRERVSSDPRGVMFHATQMP